GLNSDKDIAGFNRALGISDQGWVPFDAPDGAENFQVLSPVRMHAHGVYEINRWVQHHFRAQELKRARERRALKLGDEEIVLRDKVIQLDNGVRRAWNGKNQVELYLANGEVGILTSSSNGFLNAIFAGRPGVTFGYKDSYDFADGAGPLELAYALTVHKA